jgi:hypothetical protein
MKAYEGVDVTIHIFLTSALVGRKLSASCLGLFSLPGKSHPCSHWIGGWVGPGIGVDDMKKKYCPYRDSNSVSSTIKPVVSRYTIFIV